MSTAKIKVGTPLNLNPKRNMPRMMIVLEYRFPILNRFIPVRIKKNPEVMGMSCHKVTPMAPTTGVALKIIEAEKCLVSLEISFANSVREIEKI
jgi:hypothetical protein